MTSVGVNAPDGAGTPAPSKILNVGKNPLAVAIQPVQPQ